MRTLRRSPTLYFAIRIQIVSYAQGRTRLCVKTQELENDHSQCNANINDNFQEGHYESINLQEQRPLLT